MHIENLTINFGQAQEAQRELLSAMLSEAPAAFATAPPRINNLWGAQGGIYAGISRGEGGAIDTHLILCEIKPDTEVTWEEAKEWASKLNHNGFKDWSLPSRFEGALLYANLRDQFETSGWYWLCTPFSSNYTWCQGFYHGFQGSNDKGRKLEVRAVRRLTV